MPVEHGGHVTDPEREILERCGILHGSHPAARPLLPPYGRVAAATLQEHRDVAPPGPVFGVKPRAFPGAAKAVAEEYDRARGVRGVHGRSTRKGAARPAVAVNDVEIDRPDLATAAFLREGSARRRHVVRPGMKNCEMSRQNRPPAEDARLS